VFDHGGVPHQVRVDGVELVFRAGDEERREALGVDPVAAARLADFFAFGAATLEELRATAAGVEAPTPAWLWP
jgi:hypothetical protein